MSRAEIFAKVRAALSPETDAERASAVVTRISNPPLENLPARARVTGENAIANFTAHLSAQGVTMVRVTAREAIPEAVAQILNSLHPQSPLVTGTDPWLQGLPWKSAPQLQLESWQPGRVPVIALSRAAAGIAETGTLVLASGPDNPATLNYLPESHIVVIEAESIGGSMEEAFSRVRGNANLNAMPRTLALVSGASRTADVGGKLVRGAHGPKNLAVIVVG